MWVGDNGSRYQPKTRRCVVKVCRRARVRYRAAVALFLIYMYIYIYIYIYTYICVYRSDQGISCILVESMSPLVVV